MEFKTLKKKDVNLMDLTNMLQILKKKLLITQDLLIPIHKKISIKQMMLILKKSLSMIVMLLMVMISFNNIPKLDQKLKTPMYVEMTKILKMFQNTQETLLMYYK